MKLRLIRNYRGHNKDFYQRGPNWVQFTVPPSRKTGRLALIVFWAAAGRTRTVTHKVKTAFGSMHVHVEMNEQDQPVGGSISDPGKEPDSQIARLIEDLSAGLDAALRIGPRVTLGPNPRLRVKRMREVLDVKRPYAELDEGSDPIIPGADFVEQDGVIYAWSESNVRYERAWWLYPDADASSPLVRHLRKTRIGPGLQTLDETQEG
jgi:hypothetical protein